MSTQSQNNPQTATGTTATSDNPPDYDTLSLAPPSINQDQPSPSQSASTSSSIRQKFAALKAEDQRRKSERLTHVSAEEADRITGLDRHRVEEEKKSAERKRGGKSMLGMLMLS